MYGAFTIPHSAMKDSWSMTEVVLPSSLSRKEKQCAEEVARDLDLLTEKVGNLLSYLIP